MTKNDFFLEGRIIVIDDIQEITERFKKRQIVIETEEDYPQTIAFDFLQDRCSIPDSYKVDDEVRVYFNVSGREWKGKYFVNLRGWRMEPLTFTPEKKGSIPQRDIPLPPQDSAPKQDTGSETYEDDLPF